MLDCEYMLLQVASTAISAMQCRKATGLLARGRCSAQLRIFNIGVALVFMIAQVYVFTNTQREKLIVAVYSQLLTKGYSMVLWLKFRKRSWLDSSPFPFLMIAPSGKVLTHIVPLCTPEYKLVAGPWL